MRVPFIVDKEWRISPKAAAVNRQNRPVVFNSLIDTPGVSEDLTDPSSGPSAPDPHQALARGEAGRLHAESGCVLGGLRSTAALPYITRTFMRSTAFFSTILAAMMLAPAAAAQQRPLQTQDPETIGTGHVLMEAGVSYARDAFYPLSGLMGTLWQLPAVGFDVGLSPIADLQITGGPYNRLAITRRAAAPLASLVTATADTTHAVEDIAVGTKIRLVPEAAGRPSVGFRFSVRLPNAKHESGLGQDTTDFSASLLTGKTVGSLRVVANLGFTIMSEPLDAAKQNDVVTYGLSCARPIWPHVDLVGDVNGRWSTRNGVPPIGTESRGTVTAGGRYTRGAVRLDAAAFIGLAAVDPTVGLKIGVTYVFSAFSLP
jgi:hypothetical protein